MRRLIMAGVALSFAAVPAFAQTGNTGNAGSAGRGSGQSSSDTHTPPPTSASPGTSTSGMPGSSGTSAGSMTGSAGPVTTATEARSRIQSSGYRNISGLAKGADGMWHATAQKGAQKMQIQVDGQGNVIAAQ
jgi:hypothetical protein